MRWFPWPRRSAPSASGPFASVIGGEQEAEKIGEGSSYAEELRQAVAAAVECGGDRVKFVNESEVVLSRLQRALTHFRQQRFADERQVLESLEGKDSLVHFFLDCVRNRFVLRARVGQLRSDLISTGPAWERAFRDHVARCATCRTVDLTKPQPPAPPAAKQERLPIPFAVELLALFGFALPFFALFQGCNCRLRPWLVLLGLGLCVPFCFFEGLWRLGARRWLLWSLSAGSYSAGSRRRALRWPWAPSRSELRHDEGDASLSCVAYGQWYRCPQPTPSMTVRRSTGKPDLPDGSERARFISVSAASHAWTDISAVIEATGEVQGLPMQASFDGDAFTMTSSAGGEPQVWAKVGCWRMEWLYKTIIALAVLGMTMAIVAAAFHPGLTPECGPQISERSQIVRTPLRAVFLVDASSSITSEWEDEKRAAEAIIDAFKEVYEPDVERLHVGVAQFASRTELEQPLTNDLGVALSSLRSMQQVGGGTSFAGPLRECQRQLDQYSGAASDTFDLCILITDGNSDEDNQELEDMKLLSPATKLMGIYVGENSAHREKLHDLTSCGSQRADCPFFESAADFELLRGRARDLASSVTTGLENEVTERVVTHRCDIPLWTLHGIWLWIPLLIWWCYLHVSLPQRQAQPAKHTPKDPQRLCTAGANESRKV